MYVYGSGTKFFQFKLGTRCLGFFLGNDVVLPESICLLAEEAGLTAEIKFDIVYDNWQGGRPCDSFTYRKGFKITGKRSRINMGCPTLPIHRSIDLRGNTFVLQLGSKLGTPGRSKNFQILELSKHGYFLYVTGCFHFCNAWYVKQGKETGKVVKNSPVESFPSAVLGKMASLLELDCVLEVVLVRILQSTPLSSVFYFSLLFCN